MKFYPVFFRDVSLATLCRVYLKLNKYKKQIRKGNSNAHLPPAYLTLEKARLCIVKFPNSLKLSYILKCLDKIFFLFEIIFTGVVLMFNL